MRGHVCSAWHKAHNSRPSRLAMLAVRSPDRFLHLLYFPAPKTPSRPPHLSTYHSHGRKVR